MAERRQAKLDKLVETLNGVLVLQGWQAQLIHWVLAELEGPPKAPRRPSRARPPHPRRLGKEP